MSILKTYIQNALKTGNLVIDSSTKGRINALITKELNNWTGPKSISTPTTIRSLVAYEVNKFKSYGYSPVESVIKEETTKTTNTKRTSGLITVLKLSPLQGQLDTGELISFTSKYAVKIGETYKYTYNTKTGIYTVHTYQKPFVKPLTGVYSGSDVLSLQEGYYFHSIDPTAEAKNNLGKYDFESDNHSIQLRLDHNTVGKIQDGWYIETSYTKNTKTNLMEATEILKIDLTSKLALNTTELLTVGKYILIGDLIYILVFKHTPYPTLKIANPVEANLNYQCRRGEAAIRGELIVINRTTKAIFHKQTTQVKIANQLYYAGIVDIIKDKLSENIIIAELSTTPVYRTLDYTTAYFLIKKEDLNPVGSADVIKYTTAEFYTWLNAKYAENKLPDCVNIVKDGAASWDLAYPTLTISSCVLDIKNEELIYDKTLYTDNTAITSRHTKDCLGGYINCILYQDVFDEKNNYPIYFARGYDAWLQFPYPAASYIVRPFVDSSRLNFVLDSGIYTNSAAPGELIGFFGHDFFSLKEVIDKTTNTKTLEATLVANIPGDYGISRSFAKNDVPGSKGASGITTDSYNTLVQLNDYAINSYALDIEKNSLYCIFTGGPGNCAHASYTNASSTYRGYDKLWGIGIHTYTTRFAIVKDPITQSLYLLLAGSYEPCLKQLNTDNNYNHGEDSFDTTKAFNSVFIVPFDKGKKLFKEEFDYWPIIEASTFGYLSKEFTNNPIIDSPIPEEYIAAPQVTNVASRFDIQLLDYNTAQIACSTMQRQFDLFKYYSANTNRYVVLMWGWIRQIFNLEVIKVSNDAITSGLNAIVVEKNTYPPEKYGAMTPKLQYY